MHEALNAPPPAFDPALPGIDEAVWLAALEDAATLILPEADIVVVSPHPDDETFGAGGLISTAMQHAQPVTVVSVTNGERAFSDWRGLSRVRRREVKQSLRTLSPRPVPVKRLGIPDGRVSDFCPSLIQALGKFVTSRTLLVAPYEQDGHPDHEATGEACAEVARDTGATLWRYPIWAWHHGAVERLAAARWGRFWLDPATQRTKSMAVNCFASQLRPASREPVVPAHILNYFNRPYEAFLT